MAKGVDELVNHVLSEVALTGVQGTHDSRFSFCFSSVFLPKSDCSACCTHTILFAKCCDFPRALLFLSDTQPRHRPIRRSSPILCTSLCFVHRNLDSDMVQQELAATTSSDLYRPSTRSSNMKTSPVCIISQFSWAQPFMRRSGNGLALIGISVSFTTESPVTTRLPSLRQRRTLA